MTMTLDPPVTIGVVADPPETTAANPPLNTLRAAARAALARRRLPLVEKNTAIFEYVLAGRAAGLPDHAIAAALGVSTGSLGGRMSMARAAGHPLAPPVLTPADWNFRSKPKPEPEPEPEPEQAAKIDERIEEAAEDARALNELSVPEWEIAPAVEEEIQDAAEEVDAAESAARARSYGATLQAAGKAMFAWRDGVAFDRWADAHAAPGEDDERVAAARVIGAAPAGRPEPEPEPEISLSPEPEPPARPDATAQTAVWMNAQLTRLSTLVERAEDAGLLIAETAEAQAVEVSHPLDLLAAALCAVGVDVTGAQVRAARAHLSDRGWALGLTGKI